MSPQKSPTFPQKSPTFTASHRKIPQPSTPNRSRSQTLHPIKHTLYCWHSHTPHSCLSSPFSPLKPHSHTYTRRNTPKKIKPKKKLPLKPHSHPSRHTCVFSPIPPPFFCPLLRFPFPPKSTVSFSLSPLLPSSCLSPFVSDPVSIACTWELFPSSHLLVRRWQQHAQ